MPTTTNMAIVTPTIGVTTDPSWSTLVNAAFDTIDAHDHSSGKGARVTPSGFNINQDLTFAGFNATNLRTSRYTSQSAVFATSTDKSCVYVVSGELYFRDASGNNVQITSLGGINLSSTGTIGGDYSAPGSTASVTYTLSTKTFTFLQSAGVTAKMAMGDIALYENVAAAQPITIKSATGVASAYTLTLPAAAPTDDTFLESTAAGALSWKKSLVNGGSNAANQVPYFTDAKTVASFALTAGQIVLGTAGAPGASSVLTIAGDGTALLPAYSFNSDPNTGFYRVANDTIGVTCNGAQVATWEAAGLNVTNGNANVTGTGFNQGAVQTLGTVFASALIQSVRAGGAASIGGVRFNGTYAAKTTVLTTETLLQIQARAYDGTSYLSCGQITVNAEGTVGTGFVPTNMKFYTANASGTSTVALTLSSAQAATFAGAVTVAGASTLSSTLAVTGATTLSSTLAVTGATTHTGAVTCSTTLAVTGNTTVGGTLTVTGATTTAGITAASLNVTVNAVVGANLTVGGVAVISSTLAAGASTLASLGVTGAATVGSTLGVTGAATLSSTLAVTSNATVGGTLSAGASTLASLGVTGAATVGTTLGVSGAATMAGISCASINVSAGVAITGNISVGGVAVIGSTLDVGGVATFASSGSVAGNFAMAGAVQSYGVFDMYGVLNCRNGLLGAKFTVDNTTGNTNIVGTTSILGGMASAGSLFVKVAVVTSASGSLSHLSINSFAHGLGAVTIVGATATMTYSGQKVFLSSSGMASPGLAISSYDATNIGILSTDGTRAYTNLYITVFYL